MVAQITTLKQLHGYEHNHKFRRMDSLSLSDQELIPNSFGDLKRDFSNRKLHYIASVLNDDEIKVLSDNRDALIIARIKRMSKDKLKKFDSYVPKNEEEMRLYELVQVGWLRTEEWLVGTRLRRRPTQKELFADFLNNNNGLRFRAYYTMKYPERMTLSEC